MFYKIHSVLCEKLCIDESMKVYNLYVENQVSLVLPLLTSDLNGLNCQDKFRSQPSIDIFWFCNYGYETYHPIKFKLFWFHSYFLGSMLSVRSPVWKCWMTQRCRRKREHRPGRLTGCRRAEMVVKGGRISIADSFFT